MKNLIYLKGFTTDQNINVINIDRLTFYKNKEKQIKPKFKITSLNDQINEHIKVFLSQETYRPLVMGSFGDVEKQEQLRNVLYNYVSSKEFLDDYSATIGDFSLDSVTDILVEKITGLDVLQPLTEIPTVTDIKCIDWDSIWVDDISRGLYKTDIKFSSEQAYLELCHRFAYGAGKTFSQAKPSVNAMFPYLRVNIVGYDLSKKPSMQLRVIKRGLRFNEEYMLNTGYANEDMINFLKLSISSESHIISGSTGTGKTELLRHFTKYTPIYKSIIAIEDNPEMYLGELYPDKAINEWANREASDDSKKAYDYSYHIRNAVRQNPDYIYIQESLGAESVDVLEASETDHIVNTTLHAKSAFDAVIRFMSLCQKGMYDPSNSYGKRITSAFKIGIHLKRFGNVRKINQIVEYVDFADGEVKANILFQYDPILQKHKTVSPVSNELWERMLEVNHDLTSIQMLAPTDAITALV